MDESYKNTNLELSIVSPVYMAEGILYRLVEEISNACDLIKKNYEIILVDDGSEDNSWAEIKKICKENNIVKGLKLSRNFGQHVAIKAGIKKANGNWIVVMDCDLQDNPYEIKNLYNKALEGYPIVRAKRKNRKDHFFKKLSSIIFYKIYELFTGISQNSSIANFGIYHMKVIKAISKLNDKDPFFPSQINWIGFPRYDLNVIHGERITKKSNYTKRKLLQLGFNNIILYSDKPLKFTIKLGFIISLISFLLGIIYSLLAISRIFSVSGFASIIITLFFSTGIIIFVIGIIGLYVGKIFEASKNRPLYIIEERLN